MPGRSASSKISFRLDRLFGQRQAVEGISLACGHMRELEEKQAHKDGMVHVVAIDQALKQFVSQNNMQCRMQANVHSPVFIVQIGSRQFRSRICSGTI